MYSRSQLAVSANSHSDLIHPFLLLITVAHMGSSVSPGQQVPQLEKLTADILCRGKAVTDADRSRVRAFPHLSLLGHFPTQKRNLLLRVCLFSLVPETEQLLIGVRRVPFRTTKKQVVFFDDSMPNVNGANLGGFLAFHTPKAFTRGAWRDACSSAGNRLRAEDALLGSGKSEAGAAEGASPPSSESA